MSDDKLLVQVRRAIRVRQYSRRTEQAYVRWLEAYVRYAGRRRVEALGEAELEVRVCEPKGARGRVTMLPQAELPLLQQHLARVRALHRRDAATGAGGVSLPGALHRKLPGAITDWVWQWVFPARRRYRDGASGALCRHRWHPSNVPCAVRRAPGGRVGRDCQARDVSHIPSLVRHSPSRIRLRYSHCAGAALPPGRPDHDDLHACAEPRQTRRPQPCGRSMTHSAP